MTNSSTINEFIKTKGALDVKKKDPKLGVRGFEFDNSTSEKDCVLVIGLNPTGNEKDVNNIKISSWDKKLFK